MAFVLKHDKKESANKTIRFPCSMIEEIEARLREENGEVSFSSFVLQACAYVLEDMDKTRGSFAAASGEDPNAKAGDDD